MITTPTLWPDGTVPSAEQFAEWLTRLSRPELVEVTERLLSEAAAAACRMMDHAGQAAELAARRNAALRCQLAGERCRQVVGNLPTDAVSSEPPTGTR